MSQRRLVQRAQLGPLLTLRDVDSAVSVVAERLPGRPPRIVVRRVVRGGVQSVLDLWPDQARKLRDVLGQALEAAEGVA